MTPPPWSSSAFLSSTPDRDLEPEPDRLLHDREPLHLDQRDRVERAVRLQVRAPGVHRTGGASRPTVRRSSAPRASDSTLLQINGSVPNSVFYVGWTPPPTSPACHPAGDRMKAPAIVSNRSADQPRLVRGGLERRGHRGRFLGPARTAHRPEADGGPDLRISSCGNQNGSTATVASRGPTAGWPLEYLELDLPDDPLDDNDDCNSASFLGQREATTTRRQGRGLVPGDRALPDRAIRPRLRQRRHRHGHYTLSCSGDLVAVKDTNTNDESVQWSAPATSGSTAGVPVRRRPERLRP